MYSELKSSPNVFFSSMQDSYPKVPARNIGHNISKNIKVGATFKTDKLVATLYWTCGFWGDGCRVSWSHRWYITPAGTLRLVEKLDDNCPGTHVHTHGMTSAIPRDSARPTDKCDMRCLPDKYQPKAKNDSCQMHTTLLKPLQRYANALTDASMEELLSGNPSAVKSNYNSHRVDNENDTHRNTPWIPEETYRNSRKPAGTERIRWLC